MNSKSSGIYKVLYRKWRPKTFDEVVGQGHITEILKGQISSGRVSHALMFCGSRGTGKTSCAKIFAKAVNCLKNSNGNPCLECEICKKIESGSILDVVEIDAASNNGVENIRSIKEESNFVSSEAKFRVYIIDEFHMLSSGAFNAFLRTLEEPSKNVIFILATTEFNKIPKTIVSRCQKFDFRRLNVKDMTNRLRFVSNEESIEVTDDALDLICRNSEGSMRDSLSILDQCVSYGRNINREHVEHILGISNTNYVEKLVNFIFDSNLGELVKIVEDLYLRGRNLVKEYECIMNYFYDIFFYHLSNSFLDSSINDHESIIKSASKISLTNSIKCFKILDDFYYQMQKSANVKAEFEIAMVSIFYKINGNLNKSEVPNTNNTYEKENELTTSGKANASIKLNKLIVDAASDEFDKSIDAESSATEPYTGNKPEKMMKSDRLNGTKPLESWEKILSLIKKHVSSSLASMLSLSKAYVNEDEILVDTNSFIFGMIKKSYTDICSLVKKCTGKSYKIRMLDSETSKKNTELDRKMDMKSFTEEAKKCGIDVEYV